MTPIPKTFKYWKRKEQEKNMMGDHIGASYCKGHAEGVMFVGTQLKNILHETKEVHLLIPHLMQLIEGRKEYFNKEVKFSEEDEKSLF